MYKNRVSGRWRLREGEWMQMADDHRSLSFSHSQDRMEILSETLTDISNKTSTVRNLHWKPYDPMGKVTHSNNGSKRTHERGLSMPMVYHQLSFKGDCNCQIAAAVQEYTYYHSLGYLPGQIKLVFSILEHSFVSSPIGHLVEASYRTQWFKRIFYSNVLWILTESQLQRKLNKDPGILVIYKLVLMSALQL